MDNETKIKVVKEFILKNKRVPNEKKEKEIWSLYKSLLQNTEILPLRKRYGHTSSGRSGHNYTIEDLVRYCEMNKKIPSCLTSDSRFYLFYRNNLGNPEVEKLRLMYGRITTEDVVNFCKLTNSLPDSKSLDPKEVRLYKYYERHKDNDERLSALYEKYSKIYDYLGEETGTQKKSMNKRIKKVRSFIEKHKRLPRYDDPKESYMYYIVMNNKREFIDLRRKYGGLETNPYKVAISDMRDEGLIILDDSILEEEGRT